MSIYAIADLHLSFSSPKPMDIFGEKWTNHELKIKENWEKTINENDLILLLGDFSWAITLEEAKEDFKYLNNLPGKKLMLKGNHDYWWNSLKKLNEYIEKNEFKNISFLHNNAYEFEKTIIAGTRGWLLNSKENEDKKIVDRELLRLELSINAGIKKYGEGKEIIVCMHYPPTNKIILENSEFIKLMQKYNVKKCIYGHLHGEAHNEAVEGNIGGIELKLISADYVDFNLTKII